MARYAKILHNDTANGTGVGVAFFTQGCPHHCPGCFNPETWDFSGGKNFEESAIKEIIDSLDANGIKRHLSILGGEPLCPENRAMVRLVIERVREEHSCPIYLWTGYTLSDLRQERNEDVDYILRNIDFLIDGRFVEAKKDLKLVLRGSTNQKIYTREDLIFS